MNFHDFVSTRRKKPDDDSKYMEIALKAAEFAKANGENPFGAVLVFPGGHMVEHDTCFSDRDRTCHAEMNVMRKVAQTLRRLDDCILYTTVEPCPMCAHAALLNGVKEIIFGAVDQKNGFLSSNKLLNVAESIVAKGGVMAEQCVKMLPEHLQEHIKLENSNNGSDSLP